MSTSPTLQQSHNSSKPRFKNEDATAVSIKSISMSPKKSYHASTENLGPPIFVHKVEKTQTDDFIKSYTNTSQSMSLYSSPTLLGIQSQQENQNKQTQSPNFSPLPQYFNFQDGEQTIQNKTLIGVSLSPQYQQFQKANQSNQFNYSIKTVNLPQAKPDELYINKLGNSPQHQPTLPSYTKSFHSPQTNLLNLSYPKPLDLTYPKPLDLTYPKPSDLTYAQPNELIIDRRIHDQEYSNRNQGKSADELISNYYQKQNKYGVPILSQNNLKSNEQQISMQVPQVMPITINYNIPNQMSPQIHLENQNQLINDEQLDISFEYPKTSYVRTTSNINSEEPQQLYSQQYVRATTNDEINFQGSQSRNTQRAEKKSQNPRSQSTVQQQSRKYYTNEPQYDQKQRSNGNKQDFKFEDTRSNLQEPQYVAVCKIF